jgi:hypothetical protein
MLKAHFLSAIALAACMSTSATANETIARKVQDLFAECHAPASVQEPSPSESLAELFCYQYKIGTLLLRASPEHWQTEAWQRDYDEHWIQLVVLHGMLRNGADLGSKDEFWAEHKRRLIEAGSRSIWVPDRDPG